MSRISQSTRQMKLYYWTQENARSEIDFLLQTMGQIVPVEVKAEENLQSKSLRTYFQKYTPGAAIRDRKSNTSELQSLMRNSYAVFCLKKKNKKTLHSHSIET